MRKLYNTHYLYYRLSRQLLKTSVLNWKRVNVEEKDQTNLIAADSDLTEILNMLLSGSV